MDIKKITAIELEQWKKESSAIKNLEEGRKHCRKFRDKFELTDREATNVLFRNKNISEI
jgi:hypothetical protein